MKKKPKIKKYPTGGYYMVGNQKYTMNTQDPNNPYLQPVTGNVRNSFITPDASTLKPTDYRMTSGGGQNYYWNGNTPITEQEYMRANKFPYGGEAPIGMSQDTYEQNTGVGQTQPQIGSSMWGNMGSYAGMITAGAASGTASYDTYNDPNSTKLQKANSTIAAQNAIQGAVPMYGQFQKAGKMIEKPIIDKMNKQNPEAAFVAQNIIDPANYIGYASSGIYSPKQYAAEVQGQPGYAMGGIKMKDGKPCYSCGGMKYVTGGKVTISKSELAAEHKHLLNVLRKGDPDEMSEESDNQREEMREYGIKLSKGGYAQYGVPAGVYATGGYLTHYPDGGANAEIEKQEMFRTPDGETVQVDGKSHEQGGIPVNIPAGTEIFSDRLKMPGTKKTFAKLAAKYKTNKEDKVLDDEKSSALAKHTADLVKSIKHNKLDEIFSTQETLKQDKVKNYAKKMGVELDESEVQDNSQEENQEYKSGGKHWIQGAINPKHKGYCTPMSKPTCTGRRRALALTLKKHHGFHKKTMGGIQYPNGGTAMDLYNKEVQDLYSQYGNTPYDVTSPDYKGNVLPAQESAPNQRKQPNYGDYIEPTVNTLLQNSGNLWDLYQTKFGKKYDKENYGQVTPTTLNDKQALIDADIQNRISRGQIKDAVSGNAGAYLSNVTGAQTANTLNKARIREQYQNQNAGILNSFAQYNKGLEMQSKIDTEQNKARAEDIARQAIRGIGTNTSAAYRDYKGNMKDQQMMKYISNMYPDYKFDEKRGWYYNSKGKPLVVKEG